MPKTSILESRYLMALVLCILFLGLISCTEDPKIRFQNWNQEGDTHFKGQEYKAALTAWKNALEIRPKAPDIYKKIGQAYLRMAFPSEAADAFCRELRIQPDAWDVWLELAKLQLASLDIAGAERSWDQVQKGTLTPDAHIFHGNLMLVKNDLDKAEVDYQQALSMSPDHQQALIRLAICLFAQGKTVQAAQTYETLLAQEPRSREILLEMGNYWKLRNDLENAEACLLRAVNSDSENLGTQKILAEFYFGTAQYQKAKNVLETILTQTPKNRLIKKFLVEVLLSLNQTREANGILEALSGKQNDLELYLLKGKYCLLVQDPANAASHFLSAVRMDSKLPVVHYFLAIAYLYKGQPHLAKQSLIQALTLDPKFSDADLALADIYYKEGAFDLSLEHARRIQDREPENFRAHLIAGNAFLAQEQYDQAANSFRAVQRLHPELVSSAYYLGVTAELSEQHDAALRLYRELLEKAPDLADANTRYARLLIRSGQIRAARQFFQEAVTRNPQNGYLQNSLGEVHLALGETDKARAAFEQAVSLDPGLVSAYLELADIHEQRQVPDAQITVLEACIRNMPHFLGAYLRLAPLYAQKGDLEKAVTLLESAAIKNPDDPRVSNNLAWLYLEQEGKADKALSLALSLALSAYERLPDDPAAADTLGWAYYKNNSFTRAIWVLTDAASRTPDHPLIHFHLGMALHADGNSTDAAGNLRHAIELKLKSPQLEQAREVLRQTG